MNLPIKFLALTTLTLLTSLCCASEESAKLVETKTKQKWYRVEVIIFTQKDAFGDELSSRDIVLTYPENLIDLDNNSAAYTALPEDKLELGPDAYALKRTGVYTVLFHKAWRQPGLSPGEAPWINIDVSDEKTSLNGSLRVYLSSYLHLESNIWHLSYAPELEALSVEPLVAEATGNKTLIQEEDSPETETTIPPLAPWPRPPISPLKLMAAAELEIVQAQTDQPGFGQPDLVQPVPAHPDTALANTTLTAAEPLNTGISEQNEVTVTAGDILNTHQKAIDDIILLQQASRLMLNKLHYFDHPKMGLLVKVSRDKTIVADAFEKSEAGEKISAEETPAKKTL